MSGSLKLSRLLAASLPVLLLSALGLCQTPVDRHFASPSRALYEKSAYAHGYMHGYEEGFHNGDLDIHMGRGERPLSQVKAFRECPGFRVDFGDKSTFKLGYQQGFREGYEDAVSGRSFRAVNVARRISLGMPESSSLSGRDFDVAFAKGYDTGRDVGATATTDQVNETYTNDICASRLPHSQRKNQGAFCDAFSRGFVLGFSDGHINRAPSGTETARNTEAGKQ